MEGLRTSQSAAPGVPRAKEAPAFTPSPAEAEAPAPQPSPEGPTAPSAEELPPAEGPDLAGPALSGASGEDLEAPVPQIVPSNAQDPGEMVQRKLESDLESLLQQARPEGQGASAASMGQSLSDVEALAGEVLGEDRFVGEESLCPACGAVTSVYADSCARCGALFDTEVCKCAHCGAWVPSESLFCDSCQQPLVNPEALCPTCSSPVPYHAPKCPRCGAELVEGEMRCARCGSGVTPTSITCDSCGLLLVEGARKRTEAIAAAAASGGSVAGVQVGAIKATLDGGSPIRATLDGTGVTEVEVENRIENKLTVEAVLKQPEGPAGGPAAAAAERQLQQKEARNKLAKAKARRSDAYYPFSAVVGQEKMKTALLLNVIDPLVGGVLVSGQKGTGKSVTVRGLTEVTPQIRAIEGCRFSCDPARPGDWCWECHERFEGRTAESIPTILRPLKVVDLPLNATEDRVVGTLDVGRMLTEGEVAFEHGVLAEANRGVLYVDEINLLDDYVVDVLLDAAAMGRVTVEREGVSVSYPARFVMVGSMNPEEGSLRPQLLDRIALMVTVTGVEDLEGRKDIVRRREEFERDPKAFRTRFEPTQQQLRDSVAKAREILPRVDMTPKLFSAVPKVTTSFGVDGHRADIMIERGAKALAAYHGRTEVTSADLGAVAEMVLPHRMRRKPLEQAEFNAERLKRVIEENV